MTGEEVLLFNTSWNLYHQKKANESHHFHKERTEKAHAVTFDNDNDMNMNTKYKHASTTTTDSYYYLKNVTIS
jgi:hypothetical protein